MGLFLFFGKSLGLGSCNNDVFVSLYIILLKFFRNIFFNKIDIFVYNFYWKDLVGSIVFVFRIRFICIE